MQDKIQKERAWPTNDKTVEPLVKVVHSVIPAKAGIQNCLEVLDSGSRFACPE
jgi:hypothetical protein